MPTRPRRVEMYQSDGEDTIEDLKQEIRDIQGFIKTMEHNKREYGEILDDESYEEESSESSSDEEDYETMSEDTEEEDEDTEEDSDY